MSNNLIGSNYRYLNSEEVYIYPSSNADDGGAVNTERNVADITHKLIYKNYVVCHEGDLVYDDNGKLISAPLMVKKVSEDKNTITITAGNAVLEGYYIKVMPIKGSFEYNIDKDTLNETTYYFLDTGEVVQTDVWSNYVRISELVKSNFYNTDGSKKILDPIQYAAALRACEGYDDMPRLHVVMILRKNLTGNVSGDRFWHRSSDDPSSNIRICGGLQLTVLDDYGLSQLKDSDTSYLIIGDIILDPEQLYQGNTVIVCIDNENKYAYISLQMIISPEGNQNLEEWINSSLHVGLKHLDTIRRFDTDPSSAVEVFDEKVALTVKKDGSKEDVRVIRYEPKTPAGYTYDPEGFPPPRSSYTDVVEKTGYDESYSIDDIQKRTHVASLVSSTSDTIAKNVDSRDTGKGKIKSYTDSSHEETYTNNGTSKLIARADHNHDNRYILSSAACKSESPAQSISTDMYFSSKLSGPSSSSTKWYIQNDGKASFKEILVLENLSISNNLTVGNKITTKDLSASGTVTTKYLSVTDSIIGPVSVNGNLTVTGNTSTKNLTVTNDTTTKNLTATTEIVTPILKVTNKIVGGDGPVTVDGDLKVTGKIKGPATVEGNLTTDTLKVNTKVTGPLNIDGTLNIGSYDNNSFTKSFGFSKSGLYHYDSEGNSSQIVTSNGYVYRALWNDYAELYKKDNKETIEPGSLICKVPGKDTYTYSTYDNRKLVVGVSSDSYAMIIGGEDGKTLEENLEDYIPVALNGRVRVQVVKGIPIQEGDLLVASKAPGKAIVDNNPSYGTVVGKALESSNGDKERILMQVMLG